MPLRKGWTKKVPGPSQFGTFHAYYSPTTGLSGGGKWGAEVIKWRHHVDDFMHFIPLLPELAGCSRQSRFKPSGSVARAVPEGEGDSLLPGGRWSSPPHSTGDYFTCTGSLTACIEAKDFLKVKHLSLWFKSGHSHSDSSSITQ